MIFQIAVASPEYPSSLRDGIHQIKTLAKEAASAGAQVVCFPESFLPGYPLPEYERESGTEQQLRASLEQVSQIAKENDIAIIIPMDWYENGAFLNVAFVITRTGDVSGYQTKNQLDPSEDRIWQAGDSRQMFEIDGLRFGIVICHEGFRYPETVRWAARNGAHVVFHPNLSGGKTGDRQPQQWGERESPYYEKAQMVRALENTIYFATSNYSLEYSESASAVIDPDGRCIAWQAYGSSGVTVATIDTTKATGLLAKRLRHSLYHE